VRGVLVTSMHLQLLQLRLTLTSRQILIVQVEEFHLDWQQLQFEVNALHKAKVNIAGIVEENGSIIGLLVMRYY
jgi:hypothetical protein